MERLSNLPYRNVLGLAHTGYATGKRRLPVRALVGSHSGLVAADLIIRFYKVGAELPESATPVARSAGLNVGIHTRRPTTLVSRTIDVGDWLLSNRVDYVFAI